MRRIGRESQDPGLDQARQRSNHAGLLNTEAETGDAALTIFVKPENGGCEVKVLTDGLAWDEK
jgi:hypothetical protein